MNTINHYVDYEPLLTIDIMLDPNIIEHENNIDEQMVWDPINLNAPPYLKEMNIQLTYYTYYTYIYTCIIIYNNIYTYTHVYTYLYRYSTST